jgi:murein DD-endopeptidase MepM/ murein hydrolase activator NlpD
MRFSFPKPIKPWAVTQAWGVYNPAYQRFGFSHHNGTDVALGTDNLIRAPFAGTIIRAATQENGQWQPNGGGIFVSLISDQIYDFDDSVRAFVLADFLHCEKLLVQEGQHVILGQPLAIADNTGFSTGPHTHIQLRREQKVPAHSATTASTASAYRIVDDVFLLEDIDKNDMNDSFDPIAYYTSTYAIDAALAAAQSSFSRIVAAFLNFLKGRKAN